MSIKTFLEKIWKAIKSLFDGLAPNLKTAIEIGVTLTENIKAFIDSPVADILTAIIPGTADNRIKTLLRAKLPIILIQLKLADNCTGLSDPQEITACAVKTLQQLDGDVQSAFFHNLSIMTAQVAADGKLTWSDGVYLLEWYYQHEFKKSN